MIDLGVVTPSGSISISFVLYMGGGGRGSATSLLDLNISMTFKEYVNPIWTVLFPRGGTCQNFDRDARPIFLGLKFGQILFFWVGNFF